MAEVPSEDIELSRARCLRFYVSEKLNPSAQWQHRMSTSDLGEALDLASRSPEHEVAVFVETAAGGMLYWTSKAPDVFNSTVLRSGYS